MKFLVTWILILTSMACFGQPKKNRVPSYFGFQIGPVFPTAFIGNPKLELSTDDSDTIQFNTTFNQTVGFSFGGTVRVGLTKLVALETGINFTRRNFDITMEVPDSNIYATSDAGFIMYDIPINALFYIRLAEKWYMNASLGVAITFKPTDIAVFTKPQGHHEFRHVGLVRAKTGFELNANVGFEFRTEKSGFFYLGGSGRVPFSPLFDMIADYSYEGIDRTLTGEADGSFLSVNFKYFFPLIRNKGTQFKPGPITQ